MRSFKRLARPRGFTLVEMAIVMVILSLIIAGVVAPLSSLRDTQNRNQTDALMEEVYQALLGFAASNGYLPCPSWTNTNGVEDRLGNQNCRREHGYVPVATLGLSGLVDNNNRLIDAWSHPIRYSLSAANTWEYAKAISITPATPTFRICSVATCTSPNEVLVMNVPVVLVSRGKEIQITSANQDENIDNDNDFVKAAESEEASTYFDDRLKWLSANTLILYLVKAGQLDGS